MAYPIGEISSGTLRDEDLAETFVSHLRDLMETSEYVGQFAGHVKLVLEYDALEDGAEIPEDMVSNLVDALDEYAGPYFYFGANEGDGASFGFWFAGFDDCVFDGIKVWDTGDVPVDYSGEVAHMNDHGNVTLYAAVNGDLTEVWAIV